MSNVALWIAAFVAQAQVIPGIRVDDGVTPLYPASNDEFDVLVTVGFTAATSERAVSSETTYEGGAADGRQLFTVINGISVASGADVYQAMRDKAYEVFTLLTAPLVQPLLPQVMSNRVVFEDLMYPESVDGGGYEARLDFGIAVDSWVYA